MGLRLCSTVAALILAFAYVSGCATATDTGAPQRLTPPMGWNSWNSGIPLTEDTVRATVDAMVSSGMRDAGYRYVNLDAGWAAPTRGSDHRLRADPITFPHGIAALARYVHDRGMLLGLYASPYDETCGQDPRIASAGHEDTDAQTFAGWGVDYLKYDWCRNDANHADQVRLFTAMRNALRSTGRRIFYSINPNSSNNHHAGTQYDWSAIADMTRNTADLVPVWRSTLPPLDSSDSFLTGSYLGVPDEFRASSPAASRGHPGYFNDPDMLVVGLSWRDFFVNHLDFSRVIVAQDQLTPERLEKLRMKLALSDADVSWRANGQPGLTDSEQRTHFSLWAMLAAPLLAGNDIRTMSDQTRDILTNREVIAVDQDPLVVQATALPQENRVLVKPLSGGGVAVALFNPDDKSADIATSAAGAGLRSAPCYTVRDLWSHTETTSTGAIARTVAPHGVAMLEVSSRCR
ncbi:glycoside hydrolase family 27 protein [Mycobacterium sp. NPDC048908]|uniref:glycoside hydrolase family 27 protein n=1 Tax=Mycobacterium sp. NPDC048908 TaxID=3364292 RepID=UPI0037158396